MADLVTRVSKISTGAKLWVVGLILYFTLLWSADTLTKPASVSVPQPTQADAVSPAPIQRLNGPTDAASGVAKLGRDQGLIADSSELAGTYSGVVRNQTAGISAEFKILVGESKHAIRGCMEVKPPLIGSGSLRGTTKDRDVSFVVVSDQMRLQFDGKHNATNVTGTYLVSPSSGGTKQTGTFTLKKTSAEGLSGGFNISNCPGDPVRPDASVDLARHDKASLTIPPDSPEPRAETETRALVPPVATPVPERPKSTPTGYFTVGSTKGEVLGAQGTPTRISDSQWSYGYSTVRFQGDRVTNWSDSPVNPLRAKLLPSSESDANSARARGYFTVGSTKDEVLGVQSTPTGFSETQWSYGYSTVRFQGGRVTSWSDSPVNPLRARLLPNSDSEASTARSRGYFTVGSAKDEVLGVQGTPTQFSDSQWSYGYSTVRFQGDRVTSWSDSPVNPLRSKLLAKSDSDANGARTRGYFTVGSTKDEVLGAQGTPTQFSDSQWSYGYSNVRFRGDRVTNWSNSPVNPLHAKLLPSSDSAANSARARGYFTVGSTKDEVLGVQGTPTAFSETQWSYGYSTVRFQGGKVTNWSASLVNPLKAVASPNQ